MILLWFCKDIIIENVLWFCMFFTNERKRAAGARKKRDWYLLSKLSSTQVGVGRWSKVQSENKRYLAFLQKLSGLDPYGWRGTSRQKQIVWDILNRYNISGVRGQKPPRSPKISS